MFSRDNAHYHPTPRTTQQAFGPYAEYRAERRAFNRQRLIDIASMAACTLGAFVCAALIGVMLAW